MYMFICICLYIYIDIYIYICLYVYMYRLSSILCVALGQATQDTKMLKSHPPRVVYYQVHNVC